jgi:protein SCO1/2
MSAALAAAGARLQSRVSRLVGRPGFWTFVILFGAAFPIVSAAVRPATPPLPVLGTLDGFALTDEQGRAFGSEDLRGKVWVASFFFSRCPTICPDLMAKIVKLQKRARGIAPAFRLVSFSVDPEHDRPDVLAAWARRFAASPRIWKFVTGPLDDIKHTVEGGLKMAMGSPQGEQDFASIFHGTHFVLIDREMRIRGYYDSGDEDVADRVLHDATMLINRGH